MWKFDLSEVIHSLKSYTATVIKHTEKQPGEWRSVLSWMALDVALEGND